MRRVALALSFLSLAACSAGAVGDAADLGAPADVGENAATSSGAPGQTPGASGGESANAAGADVGSENGQEDAVGSVADRSGNYSADRLSKEEDGDDLEKEDPGPITKQDWMGRTPGLYAKSLNKIFMPGTHDSGTYGVQSVYLRPVDDAFAPDGELPIIRAGQFIGITDLWSKAQEKNISEQLNDGVRALDLRPCREKNGNLRICHGMYGPLMSDILEQVRAFAVAHPKEIVIITNGAFAGMGEADHDKLAALYEQKLGKNLLPYGAEDASPTTALGKLWSKHKGKNVIVVYGADKRPSTFWPGSVVTGSWRGDVWERSEKKSILDEKIESPPADTFFSFSGAATPDSTLITSSLDPLGTYPKSLAGMADEVNPVMLGWLRDEWSLKPANMIYIDFYNRTCVFELTQRLNGNKAASLDGCSIGTKTSWGNWRLGYERFGYGRGAGTPMGCAADEEKRGGLCYPKCAPGYSSPTLFPYVCATACPAGYRDDGLTCFRDAKIISANNSSCEWYDKCGLTFDKGCSKCPSGYKNDGCTCRRDAHMIAKTTYTRGAGVPLHTCGAGEEKSGLLCYPTCQEGFHGVGPMCMPDE